MVKDQNVFLRKIKDLKPYIIEFKEDGKMKLNIYPSNYAVDIFLYIDIYMAYIMLPDLQVVLVFIYLIIKSFEKIFMYRLAVGYIIIYHTIIISNTIDKVANYIKFRVI